MIGGAYMAYPVDQRGPASLVTVFDAIEWFKQKLIRNQLVNWTFDPGDAFNMHERSDIDDTVARINRVGLINSDLVVAWLPANTPSVGVPLEIDRAVRDGKHVIVFSDAQSWMLSYPESAVLRYDNWEPPAMEDALLWVSGLRKPEQRDWVEDMPVRLDDPSWLPVRAYDDDAGFDLIVSEDTVIAPGTFEDVPCGVSVQLPSWGWALVTGRSSALRRRGLLVHTGIIDSGYRGPLFAGAWNMTDEPVKVAAGERIAQLIVLSNMTRRVEPVPMVELSDSPRGQHGFGSTGA